MRVIIAEKPSVAREYARVLKVTSRKNGYFEREGLCVTWAFGHLVELADPKQYGFEKWRLDELPIVPDKFELVVNENEGALKQFNVIKDLFSKATEIVVGTDAGREGELIFRYIYQKCNCTVPFQRLWISSQTDKAILDGFRNLRPGTDYDPLADAARSRSEADWIIGINATRCLTLSSFSKTVLSLGRVQTPVLAMICSRYLENQDFKPEPYWLLYIMLTKDEQTFRAKFVDSFSEEEKAKEAMAQLSDTATCVKAQTKKTNEYAPLLFDLTSLQQEANKKLNLSAQETLNIAQDLYEKHKLITYPRTGSRYLTEDMYEGIPDLMEVVARIPTYAPIVAELKKKPISKRPINGKKVTDHHALLPTETDPTRASLSANEKKMYALIATRFLAAFSPVCKKEVTKLEFTCNEMLFKASGTVIIEPGWRDVEKEAQKKKKKSDEDDDDQSLPKVKKGDILPVSDPAIAKKMTKAKPVHNESTLLKLMETAGKELEDEELKDAIKECGLGTPATRASIIETLFSRDYIIRDKKKLVPTEKGLQVYDLVKDRSIASVYLTGRWEKALNYIAKGERTYDQFIDAIKKYTSDIIQNLAEVGGSYAGERKISPNHAQVGTFEDQMIQAGKGKYGTYLIHKGKFYNVENKEPEQVTLEEAAEIIVTGRESEARRAKVMAQSTLATVGRKYRIMVGKYGLYVTDGTNNASLPKYVSTSEAKTWTASQCQETIESYLAWKDQKNKAEEV